MRECVRLETNKQMHFRQLIPSGLAALNGQGKMRSIVYLDPTLFVKLSPSLSPRKDRFLSGLTCSLTCFLACVPFPLLTLSFVNNPNLSGPKCLVAWRTVFWLAAFLPILALPLLAWISHSLVSLLFPLLHGELTAAAAPPASGGGNNGYNFICRNADCLS